MASASRFVHPPLSLPPSFSLTLRSPPKPCTFPSPSATRENRLASRNTGSHIRYRFLSDDSFGESSDGDDRSFDRAVSLFNGGDYYGCHDFLEESWYGAEEPIRTLLHGILQCAVGFHHLFNQNHRGAMMELGEGLCKLRKMGFQSGPFLQFEHEISAALEFLYHTQMELAACTDDLCLAMDGSERSYQLLGSFAAGQRLYNLEIDPDGVPYIVFSPGRSYSSDNPARVKVPALHATEEHLKAYEYKC